MKNKYKPCKDCKRRYIGCHDRCQDYQYFKKLNKGETDSDLEFKSYLRDAIDRMKKTRARRLV